MRNYDDLAKELRSAMLALARGIVDEGVRSDAINSLSLDYFGTSDHEVCAVLAAVVKDQAACTWTRFLAYLGLFEVCGRPVDEYPSIEAFYSDQTSVDWQFVNRWL